MRQTIISTIIFGLNILQIANASHSFRFNDKLVDDVFLFSNHTFSYSSNSCAIEILFHDNHLKIKELAPGEPTHAKQLLSNVGVKTYQVDENYVPVKFESSSSLTLTGEKFIFPPMYFSSTECLKVEPIFPWLIKDIIFISNLRCDKQANLILDGVIDFSSSVSWRVMVFGVGVVKVNLQEDYFM